MTLKQIPFFPNPDSFHCQQAAVKSVLKYFFPDSYYSDVEIDKGTSQTGGTTWFPPAVIYLTQEGLSVQLYTPAKLDYEEFAKRGKEYIRDMTNPSWAQIQEEEGAFRNLWTVQMAAKKMLEKHLVKREAVDIQELGRKLDSPDVLAIGKTYYPWLSGIHKPGRGHFIVIIQSHDQRSWRIHDSGPPPRPDRIVPKELGFDPMFSEVLIVTREREGR